ncbi:protein PLASTID MOVEMENT IMPAIRED 1-RELATED 1 [Punica granatum]|nr:protein PLASTID MOVEMENT IMPAIRED 1-RELATED 1 [Punica granatum]XP_031395187.1 protein PLASTID MOVEMENT IMPAIRED 1-RELATED 1 [Punica granatum]XP_031395188.1 protein PLASTID MOVEMENT IMPAIRED 1-RELATED 1 [Punica granatum]XP_031395189.1 protein PLASTID MOVEMENT IMPAIRED 1-RELATED 1 [Punica granatum]
MRSVKGEARKEIDGDLGNGKLLDEIEAISKALYLDKNPSGSSISQSTSRTTSFSRKSQLPDPKSKVKYGTDDQSQKNKKSIWNWRPLKAFSHVRNRRFNCCFTLQVHTIEGLPSSFEDLSLCVHWKRRDGGLATRPAKVFQGMAEFEENLMHTCSVYGSRSGPHHSAKYEAKHFLLYAAVFGAPELDFGKHRVDLTRLLPLTLEELDEDKNSGKWTTSFRLSGKAKGASLNVSFGYLVIGDNATAVGNNQSIPDVLRSKQNELKPVARFSKVGKRNRIHRCESLPSVLTEEVKDLHEVLPVSKSELASSTDMLYQKLERQEEEEEKSEYSSGNKPELDDPEPIKSTPCDLDANSKEIGESVCEVNEFSVIEQGIEFTEKEYVISEEVIAEAAEVSTAESHDVEEVIAEAAEVSTAESHDVVEVTADLQEKVEATKCDDSCSKESLLKELELALDSVADLEVAALDSPEDCEDDVEAELNLKMTKKKGKSHSLDDVTKSVAGEFLNMLGIEHSPFGMSSESEPESPREQLLRQFEKEALAGGYSLFDFDAVDGEAVELGYDASHVPAHFELPSPKTKAKILEDLETEALMREWGMNEKAFQASPTGSSAGFGSSFDLLPFEEPLELPPLGEGLGPYLQTQNGGFLRSMNPSLFRGAKSGGSLIMQASSPVVVPAEMGSEIMEILQHLASVGIEKLSMQANRLMPLDDITGMTMQQVAMEALPSLEGVDRQNMLQHDFEVPHEATFGQKKGKERGFGSRCSRSSQSSVGSEMGSEYVSLEDLAPLALDKIEALSMEGLRIQSGMSDEEAPANISARSIGEISTLQGKGVNDLGRSLGLDGAAGLQLLDIKESNSDDTDGLMGLSLSLNEWMKLDSGEIDDDDDDQISERTSKILAAHHANSLSWIRGSKGERKRGKGSSRKCGLLGNNFTVALMVQLRDPLRNYEPVGAPMLALIQVERVFVPPKPTIYRKVSEVRYDGDEDDEQVSNSTKEDEIKEGKEAEIVSQQEGIQQFKITEVHVAGLKTDPGKKKLWGSTTQQQSGSRWLLANGMGKSNKHPFMKSKPVSKSSTNTNSATTKVQPGETLWSISSRVHGTGAKWKELAALNPHIRNPNVIFPNETIRLR